MSVNVLLLLRHHEQALNQDSFTDLRCDAFEQGKESFVLDDV